MSGAELHLRIANARTLGAMMRPGLMVPMDLAKKLVGVWEVFRNEVHANGLRLEWVGSEGWAVREGAQQPITANDVEAMRREPLICDGGNS